MILLGLLIATFFVFPDLQRLAHYLGHRSIVLVKTQAFAPFAGMTGVMFAYALLGGYLSQNAERFKATPRIVWIALFAVGALLLLIRWNCECHLSGKSWDSVYEGYATTGTLLMTASLYLLASRIDNASIARRHPLLVRATQIASENSLTVYYLHWILRLRRKSWCKRESILTAASAAVALESEIATSQALGKGDDRNAELTRHAPHGAGDAGASAQVPGWHDQHAGADTPAGGVHSK